MNDAKQYDEAIVALRQALERAGRTETQAAVHAALGTALSEQKHWAEAVEAFQAALRLGTPTAELYTSLGNSLYFAGREEKRPSRLLTVPWRSILNMLRLT